MACLQGYMCALTSQSLTTSELTASVRVQIPELDSDSRWMRALDGSEYMPGLVGLNNMSANDYVNVIVQACASARPAMHLHHTRQHQ